MTTFIIQLIVNGGRTGYPVRANGHTKDEAIAGAKALYLASAAATAAQVAAIDPTSWAAKATETADDIQVGTVRKAPARRS
jgi:hypothetical protein